MSVGGEGWMAAGHGVELGSRRSKVSRVAREELWFQSRTMEYFDRGVRSEV